MSGARLVTDGNEVVGLTLRLAATRWKYFSSASATDAMDGQVFRSCAAVRRAVRERRTVLRAGAAMSNSAD